MLYSRAGEQMDTIDTVQKYSNHHAAKKRYQLVQALSRKWLLRNRPEVLKRLEREARKRYPRVTTVKKDHELTLEER